MSVFAPEPLAALFLEQCNDPRETHGKEDKVTADVYLQPEKIYISASHISSVAAGVPNQVQPRSIYFVYFAAKSLAHS